MKVIVEKNELDVKFDENKHYPVLNNFVMHKVLGFAKISIENSIMYATLRLHENIKGYPAIGYDNRNGNKNLFGIGICETRNQDESIERIEYTQQLEGKPSNLKTK